MQIEIASDRSLLVRFGESATPECFRAVASFFQQLRSLADARIRNIHPAYTTVLIDFDPLRMSHEELAAIAEELLSPNPVTSVSYSTSSTTNPLGALIGVTYGSSDSDSFTFDPNTGRSSTYAYSVNGSTDVGTTTWNANGTLAGLSITDGISGTSDSQSCSYTFDDVNRSAGVNCGSVWGQTFTYDAFGNINKSGSSSFAPTYTTSTPTNQFSSIPGVSGPYYDSNGNLIKDNLNTYAWDPNWGNMTSVDTGSTTFTATYDALGKVVEQDNGSSYVEVLYSPVGKAALMNGTTLVKAFVGLPGGGTAVYNSSGLTYYRHADWLGNSRLASTQARGLYSSTAYAPFGEQYATSGTADPSFTGQNSDTVPSLYDFTFRKLSPSQGRWISPDPAGTAAVNPANPQSWNRYVYVLNNPMSTTDPTGQVGGGCDQAPPPGSAITCYSNDGSEWQGGELSNFDPKLLAGSGAGQNVVPPCTGNCPGSGHDSPDQQSPQPGDCGSVCEFITNVNLIPAGLVVVPYPRSSDQQTNTLTYKTTDGGPYSSDWYAQWLLSQPSPNGGWIVQHVRAFFTNDDGTGKNGKYTEYWEGFQIPKGGQYVYPHTWTRLSSDDRFAGNYHSVIKADARFYEGLTLPNSFVAGSVPWARDLRATYTNPHLSTKRATAPVFRTWYTPVP
jgi:RHS repeat-associated protein